jgi:hypothetical protein
MRPYAQPALNPIVVTRNLGTATRPANIPCTRALQHRGHASEAASGRPTAEFRGLRTRTRPGAAGRLLSAAQDRDCRAPDAPATLWSDGPRLLTHPPLGPPSRPGPVPTGLPAILGAGGATGIAGTGPRILSREARTVSLLVWEQAVLAPRPLEMDLAAPSEARPPRRGRGGTMRGLLTADQLTMERRPRLAASCINHQGGYPKWARTGSTGRATSC